MPTAELLARPGRILRQLEIDGVPYRGVVIDKPEGRVVALLDLGPYEGGSESLCCSRWRIAELAGIVASIAVVILLTRRSIRPLAEALALQRRFVADASHELRAPLTVLHTRVQLLARRFEGGDAEQTKEQIDALASDTRALGEVVEDLLASASMTSGNAPQDRVDLATVVQAASESMSQHAETAGVSLVVEANATAPAGDFVVLGSASALRRAITSLVDNALAHEHRGGTISVALDGTMTTSSSMCVTTASASTQAPWKRCSTASRMERPTPPPGIDRVTASVWPLCERSRTRTEGTSLSRRRLAAERLSLSPFRPHLTTPAECAGHRVHRWQGRGLHHV